LKSNHQLVDRFAGAFRFFGVGWLFDGFMRRFTACEPPKLLARLVDGLMGVTRLTETVLQYSP
jgi:hypothetical protein